MNRSTLLKKITIIPGFLLCFPLYAAILHLSGVIVLSTSQYPVVKVEREANGTYSGYINHFEGSKFTNAMLRHSFLLDNDGNRYEFVARDRASYELLNSLQFTTTSDNRIYAFNSLRPIDPSAPLEFYLPTPLRSPGVIIFLLSLSANIFILVLLAKRGQLKRMFQSSYRQKQIVLSLFILLFVLHRAYFVDFPLVAVHPDSASYYAPVEMLKSGGLPNFGNRPFVYPLFLFLTFSISDSLFFLAVVQSAITLISLIVLINSVSLVKKELLIPISVLLFVYSASVTVLEHDTAMLSESIYSSFIILSFANMIGFVLKKNTLAFFGFSLFSSLAVFTRPQGIFMIFVFILLLLFAIRSKISKRTLILGILPIVLFYGSSSVYNHKVVGVFAPTTWGEANLAVATMLYWQESQDYPVEINTDIAKIRNIISQRHRDTGLDEKDLKRVWNPRELSPIFLNSFNGAALDIAMSIDGTYENQSREWIRKISIDSIRQNPDLYIKFLVTMLIQFYYPSKEFSIEEYLRNRAQIFYLEKYFSSSRGEPILFKMGKELADSEPSEKILLYSSDSTSPIDLQYRVQFKPTKSLMVHNLMMNSIVRSWPKSLFVTFFFFVPFILLRKIKQNRFDDKAQVLLLLFLGHLGSAMVVSMVEFSQPRYSYPMEPILYTCALLSIFLTYEELAPSFRKTKNRISNAR
jgi:hypothetical protein